MKTIHMKILGKFRELVTLGSGHSYDLYFLGPDDMDDLRIYCGLTFQEWKDEEYLNWIRAKQERYQK